MRRLRNIPYLPRSGPPHRQMFYKTDLVSGLPRFSACILTHFYLSEDEDILNYDDVDDPDAYV